MIQDRYFVKVGENSRWQEVTKEDYVSAERGAGFRNTLGQPDEPATAGFGGNGVSGRLCYGGHGLPKDFIPLKESFGDRMMTPDEFHTGLVEMFNEHCEAARKGREEPYSFLKSEGIEYNGWIEHRHRWPITSDLLCAVSLVSGDDGMEVPFEECDTCSAIVRMYREYTSKFRVDNKRRRRERLREEQE